MQTDSPAARWVFPGVGFAARCRIDEPEHCAEYLLFSLVQQILDAMRDYVGGAGVVVREFLGPGKRHVGSVLLRHLHDFAVIRRHNHTLT